MLHYEGFIVQVISLYPHRVDNVSKAPKIIVVYFSLSDARYID